MQVHSCRAKVKGHACFYYNNLDGKSADTAFPANMPAASLLVRRLKRTESVMDIEDLVLIGSRQKYVLGGVVKMGVVLVMSSQDVSILPGEGVEV